MSEPMGWLLAAAAGAGLGLFYFSGLWWTVRKGAVSSQPALWFLGSALLRTAVVLAGFYIAGGGRWERLALCLLGFLAARVAVMRRVRAPEASHAP